MLGSGTLPGMSSPTIKPATSRVRNDIDPATTWVVSDTHFGHDNIVGYCHRPEEHEQVMIAEWRKEVPDDATLLHLGDLSYGHAGGDTRFKHLIAPELPGKRKLIVRGNHDRKGRAFYEKCGFKLAMPFCIDYSGPNGMYTAWPLDMPWRVSFSHYPWSAAEDGEITSRDWRLHGHIHNNGYSRDAFVPFLKQHINLSVEQTHYRPVNLKLLLDAVICGVYPATTDAQRDEARRRRDERKA